MNINDQQISEMGKEDFMRFVRREVLDFDSQAFPSMEDRQRNARNFSWFVRGFAIGRGWEFSPSDYSYMVLPFP